MVKPSKKAGLGRTLDRANKATRDMKNPRKNYKHQTELNPLPEHAKLDLKSVTAQTNLDEFFEEAELAGKQFITERKNVTRINDDNSKVSLYADEEKLDTKSKIRIEDIVVADALCVPRRPKWDVNTTPEVLDERERLTFLAWRKKLAKLQEIDDLTLTPFEKNLEIWRQLWRVIERSDIVVQILDCRNPLLYLCEDLIKYVTEEFKGRKLNLILLNKADFLTLEQRKLWADYFKKRGIEYIFFSAKIENEKIKTQARRISENESPESKQKSPEGSSYESDDSEEQNSDKEDVALQMERNLNLDCQDDHLRIYDKFELLDTWRSRLQELEQIRSKSNVDGQIDIKEASKIRFPDEKSECSSSHSRPLTVGLVGYPNVGKSSTINALLSAKRVAVSATPGKTKHFQTFLIDRDMMLCDCPGLVFPNFVSCKAEMVINGVLPIDQMKDYISPVRLIVERIPRGFFEDLYGLAFEYDIKQNITADDLLNAFGFMRGYMTARGLPDLSRASRVICKDYINGKILYCEPPPEIDKKLYHSHSKLAHSMKRIEERMNDPQYALRITERQRRLMVQAKGTQISSKDFDAQFFHSRTGGAHIKGLPGIGNMTQPIGQVIGVKPPKREKKHKKREKLRRVFRDLDI